MLLGIRNVDCRINITNICSHESESSQVRETLGDLSMEREVDSRASSPCCDRCSSKKQQGQNRDTLCTSGKLLQKAATLLSGLTKTTIFLANSLAIPASISGRNMFHHRTNSGLGFGFTHHRQGWRGLRTRNEPMVTQLLKNIWQKQRQVFPGGLSHWARLQRFFPAILSSSSQTTGPIRDQFTIRVRRNHRNLRSGITVHRLLDHFLKWW